MADANLTLLMSFTVRSSGRPLSRFNPISPSLLIINQTISNIRKTGVIYVIISSVQILLESKAVRIRYLNPLNRSILLNWKMVKLIFDSNVVYDKNKQITLLLSYYFNCPLNADSYQRLKILKVYKIRIQKLGMLLRKAKLLMIIYRVICVMLIGLVLFPYVNWIGILNRHLITSLTTNPNESYCRFLTNLPCFQYNIHTQVWSQKNLTLVSGTVGILYIPKSKQKLYEQ